MTDLHAHVLPGIDDGPKDLSQTEANLRQAVDDGVDILVAVAHANDHHYNVTREQYTRAFTQVEALVREKALPITVIPAMEVRLGQNLAEGYRDGGFLPVGDSGYFCVELGPIDFPSYTLDALYALALEGVRPFLIHPERNRGLRKMPDLANRLMAMGITGVASMGSLTGQFGDEVNQAVWDLIERGLIQAVATDGHSVHKRPLTLSLAYKLLEERYGEATAQDMTQNHPQRLLASQVMEVAGRKPLRRSPFSHVRRLFAR